MITLSFGRLGVLLHQRLERRLSFMKVNDSVVGLLQKTKVELTASPIQHKYVGIEPSPSLRFSSCCFQGSRVQSVPFSGVLPKWNSGPFCSLSSRIAYLHDGWSLARPRSRHFSSTPDKPSGLFDYISREWSNRKTEVFIVLLVFALAGGALYTYNQYFIVPRFSQQTESWAETLSLLGKPLTLQEAIEQATDMCQRVKDESGSPGLVVAVSVDGQQVWAQGFGYADVENRLPCKPETVMRIASISKPITMAAVAKAMEEGRLDLDKPVQTYVPSFPEKTIDGEKVTVTTRQLLSHMSGIRHYEKSYMRKKSTPANNETDSITPKVPTTISTTDTNTATQTPTLTPTKRAKMKGQTPWAGTSEFQHDEYYIKDKYETTEAALALFKDDPLVHKPGSKYLYSTHAWTLVAAVLEGATKEKFPMLMRHLFHDMGLQNTYFDENEPLIYNRARNYIRSKDGKLVNAPFVDCSYKFAGGGMLSTMPDLLQFANVMLYSFQFTDSTGDRLDATDREIKPTTTNTPKDEGTATAASELTSTPTPPPPASSQPASSLSLSMKTSHPRPLRLHPGLLKSSTVRQLWTAVPQARVVDWEDVYYGLGWGVMPGSCNLAGFGGRNPMYVLHTGGAVGASSVLLILPTEGRGCKGSSSPSSSSSSPPPPPRGVCVAMAVNMISISLRRTVLEIAGVFARVSD